MPIDPKKYVVVKREHLFDVDLGLTDGPIKGFYLSREIPDAVVIRLQDVFAASGLYSYANSIQAGIEVVESVLETTLKGLVLTPEEGEKLEKRLDYLHEVSEYFAKMAMDSDQMKGKVPD